MDISPAERVFGIRETASTPNSGTAATSAFEQLDTFVEFKPRDGEYNFGNDNEKAGSFLKPTDEAMKRLGQIAKYARHCFAFSHRLYLFTVYIRGVQACLCRWDRFGVIVTEEFDFMKNPALAIFFHRFGKI